MNYPFQYEITGKRDQKNSTITTMDTPTINPACVGLKPKPLVNPTPMSHHFQGSVIQKKNGSQETSRVSPADRA